MDSEQTDNGEKTSLTNEMFDKIMTKLSKLDALENKMQTIETQMIKIGDISKTLSALVHRIDQSEMVIKGIKQNHIELESNMTKLGEIFDSVCDKCATNKESIREITQTIAKMEANQQEKPCSCGANIAALQDQLTDLRCRSMKNNLIFSGIRYTPNEDTEYVLRNFLSDELDIHYRISFGNVHRFGKPGLNGVRPIVARFVYRVELEQVLQNAYRLKGKPYGINEQFPKEIEDKRKRLYPVMKQAKKDGKGVKMVRDKLFINGQPYNLNEPNNRTIPQFRDAAINQQPNNDAITKLPPLPPRPYKRNRTDSGSQEAETAEL